MVGCIRLVVLDLLKCLAGLNLSDVIVRLVGWDELAMRDLLNWLATTVNWTDVMELFD
jgi:hypothetical protein